MCGVLGIFNNIFTKCIIFYNIFEFEKLGFAIYLNSMYVRNVDLEMYIFV